MSNQSVVVNISSQIFGAIFLTIGVINTFWGNDPFFGVFIILLSMVYFLPADDILWKLTGFTLPRFGILKIVLGVFILWAALGVGELFDKIDLMMQDFKS